MLNRLFLSAAVSGLALSVALAQSPGPAPSAPSPSAPAASSAPTGTPAKAGERTADKGGFKNMVVTEQRPDQWLASRFKGTDVIGPNDEKIGNVNDLLFDTTGSITAVVIGVGGFLGIGAKDIAVTYVSFEPMPGQDGEKQKLKLSMTKEHLQQAAEFKPYTPPRPQAGPGPRPSPGGMRPPAQTN